MKALIFPFQQAQALAPLRSLVPDFLLPLAGKSIVEHLVEQLVSRGVLDITLLCDDRPEEVVRHFGSGERWGCRITLSAVRGQGGLQRMVRAALHGINGTVICLPGNMLVSQHLSTFLENAAGDVNNGSRARSGCHGIAIDAAALNSLVEERCFESCGELAELLQQKQSILCYEDTADSLITNLTGFLKAQRVILENNAAGCRIPARSTESGIWIGDHVQISPDVRLAAPLFIGSYSKISGSGQMGPNAVIAPYCLVNNSDLICDSMIMSGTATGSHTELNGMAARGSVLVNLRSGATVTSPDAFILGDVSNDKMQPDGDVSSMVLAAILLVLLSPLGLLLFAFSCVAPSVLQRNTYLGNRRMKTLAGDNPRVPFTLFQFSFGPLLLRRWPGLMAVLAGDLALTGAAPMSAEGTEQHNSVFGLDAACGLFHIWEVEGDLPESVEEQHARENFHYMTRTIGNDLKIIVKAATAFSHTG